MDIFGCNEAVRTALLSLDERLGLLIGQLFWVGFRRQEVPYDRRARTKGTSAWVVRRKRLRYFLDSVFAFSDLPISLLVGMGAIGAALSAVGAVVVMLAWLFQDIPVEGYVAAHARGAVLRLRHPAGARHRRHSTSGASPRT